MTNIIFFGTPDFVLPILDSLSNMTGLNPVSVVTNPDRPVGRKQIITPTPVKQWANNHSISVLTPETLDENFKFQSEAKLNASQTKFKVDLGIVAAYGKIIPQDIIDLFPRGILVVHPSLLPKYRGASPIQAAIASGEKETGVSIIKMDEQMDHGPIIYQSKSKITDYDTNESLTKKLFQETAEILPTVINDYLDRNNEPVEQNHNIATFTKLIKREHGFIPWEILEKAMKGEEIKEEILIPFIKNYSLLPNPHTLDFLIRALSPWPGAWTEIEQRTENKELKTKKRLKIIKSHAENNQLVLDLVQLEGKNPISGKQFLSSVK